MKNSFPKFSPRIIVAAVAISLGLAASAFAVSQRGGEHCGPGAGMPGQRMEHGMKEMSRLHNELKLDAKQEALWKDAEQAGKDNMASMRERFSKQREENLSLLKQPGADLRAVLKRMDELKAEGKKQHEANRDRWLTVYDSLNAEQKEKARLFFLGKLERMERGGPRGPGRG
ncbi:MAG: periplasmic heavy metal sensor [Propionivibrio sp.]|uniref:Periplasmic heavy metal sensor n=1 Tax=Candidatus Propionivibrio dominans TaxID=2954373 RepID=A0A9D7IDH6_9RHOO|nr:periplasmic heavy metal sensor [Candidatus Propionivibrio dominans]